LGSAIQLIPASTKLVAIEGAAHGLSKKSKADDIPQRIIKEFLDFFPQH
jgi:hypothetical protein